MRSGRSTPSASACKDPGYRSPLLAAASSVMTANLTAKRTVGRAAVRTEADVIALTTCTYAPAWTQMVDQDRVRKPMLYPLSYEGGPASS